MNLYVFRNECRGKFPALITNADNDEVGQVTNEVASWLVQKGLAMDLTERHRARLKRRGQRP